MFRSIVLFSTFYYYNLTSTNTEPNYYYMICCLTTRIVRTVFIAHVSLFISCYIIVVDNGIFRVV